MKHIYVRWMISSIKIGDWQIKTRRDADVNGIKWSHEEVVVPVMVMSFIVNQGRAPLLLFRSIACIARKGRRNEQKFLMERKKKLFTLWIINNWSSTLTIGLYMKLCYVMCVKKHYWIKRGKFTFRQEWINFFLIHSFHYMIMNSVYYSCLCYLSLDY